MGLTDVDGRAFASLVRPYLNWTSVPSDRLERLELILGTLGDELFPGGIIPRIQAGTILYYAIAPLPEQWRRLVPLLRASVGSTITNFTGPSIPFDDNDPLESVLIEHGYLQGARFTAGNDIRRDRYALAALARLRMLVDESHATPRTEPHTTGEMLRTFELALAALDRPASENAIAFLRTNLRLDAINLGFLTVRLHTTFREWERILQLGFFPSLCRTRRTPSITNALAEAVYRTIVITSEQEDDPQLALKLFKEDVLPHTGSLFDSCPPRPTHGSGKAFLLAAMATMPQNRQLAERLNKISREWPADEVRFFNRLFEFGFSSTPVVPTTEVVPVRTFGDEIEMLRIDKDPPNLDRARAGLIAATQLDTLDAFQVVLSYVERLQMRDREKLVTNTFNRLAYERMLETANGQTVPKNWTEWIARLEDAPLAESQEFARRAASDWSVHDHLRTEADVRELAESITRVSPVAQDRLFDTLPHLVQWLQKDDAWPESALRLLYRAIYDHLVLQLSLRWQSEVAGATRRLLDGLLQLGPDVAEYTLLLNDIGDVLPPEVGTSDFDALMELSELTVTHASPDPDVRQRLWARIIAALSPVRTRLTQGEIALVNDLGRIFGMDQVFPVHVVTAKEKRAGPSPLNNKTVAIYTLTEPVGERAKRLLDMLHPGIKVHLVHDTVSSPRLEDLARHADIFVICWRSAAHAATQIIERLRPAGGTTFYPPGKGSSSILHVIEEHFPA
ncbi:protein DpdD [Chloroflexota bacterium]